MVIYYSASTEQFSISGSKKYFRIPLFQKIDPEKWEQFQ